ncbi:hypothetical protein JYB62_16120 [Algoriphagus lutimaris]|uniref:hypothetical protein n=1 Tax=Algoriphagus lutimaris TaxID=613197 RepID=UPI00196AACB3|nr:hypothetical protein [Algoriphagus lutimaris]MBN3521538.1 hypothetical protein [Algoriphagus lutimaris]
MNSVKELYQRLTWLSLDVVFGAMGGMLFFSKLLRVPLHWTIYALLGMAVWAIYTFDHLMDARVHPIGSKMDRHGFHQKHGFALWFLLIIVGLVGLYGAYMVFGIGEELFAGGILGMIILLVMLIIRKLPPTYHWLKELNTAIFYVIGIALLPFLRFSFFDWTWETGITTAGYIALAYLNLIMLSYLDAGKDQASGYGSLVSVLPKDQLNGVIRILSIMIILVFFCGVIFLPSFYKVFSSLILIMGLIHYLTFFNKRLSSYQIRYRMEATFFLPWVLFVW